MRPFSSSSLHVWRGLPPEVQEAITDRLSSRQLEVFQHHIDRKSYRQIAWDIGIGIDTVRVHLGKAKTKLSDLDLSSIEVVTTRCGKCGSSFQGPQTDGSEWFKTHECLSVAA